MGILRNLSKITEPGFETMLLCFHQSSHCDQVASEASNLFVHLLTGNCVCVCVCVCVLSVMSHSSCDPMNCSPPGPSVHGILWARILERIAISSSRGPSQPRDRTHISCISALQVDSLPLSHWGSPKDRIEASKHKWPYPHRPFIGLLCPKPSDCWAFI